jgi:hypothetical protein
MPEMTISDGILIVATIAGPVLAVQAQKFIERAGERRKRKLDVFYTLMATRATRVAAEHVRSLNLIELEFDRGWLHNRSNEKAVIDAWRVHRDNLNQKFDESAPGALQAWIERSEGSFIELMYCMSKALGYDFDRVQLKRGAYYTRGQVEADQAQRALQDNLAKVLTGEQAIRMNVVGLPVDKEAAELQTAVQKQYLKALTGEGGLFVATKTDKRPK